MGTSISVNFEALWRAHVDLVQQAQANAPIPQYLLHGDIVDAKWLTSLDVGNGFVERKSIRVKRYQIIAMSIESVSQPLTQVRESLAAFCMTPVAVSQLGGQGLTLYGHRDSRGLMSHVLTKLANFPPLFTTEVSMDL